MRLPRWTIALLWLLGVAAVATAPACFSPNHPACAFSCATPSGTCPTGYTCGDDKICHSNDDAGACLIEFDAGSPADGAAD